MEQMLHLCLGSIGSALLGDVTQRLCNARERIEFGLSSNRRARLCGVTADPSFPPATGCPVCLRA